MKIFKYSLFFLLVLVLVAFPIVQAESFGIGALIGSARGMGPCGRGYRRGYGRGFNRTFRGFGANRVTQEEEKQALQEEAEILKRELNEVKSRLEDLEK